MSVSVGWETEGSFFRCTLIELALSILYVDPCSLDEEEHTDMASGSDSYPSLWCSITSEGRGGHMCGGVGVCGRRGGRGDTHQCNPSRQSTHLHSVWRAVLRVRVTSGIFSVSVAAYLLPSLFCVDVANVSTHKTALRDVIQRAQPPAPAQDQVTQGTHTSMLPSIGTLLYNPSKARLLTETQL